MEEKQNAARIVQRLVTDEELRRRVLAAPREVVMAELGISGETYKALMSIIPVVLAGGLYLVSGSGEPGTSTINDMPWGGWG